MKKPSIEKITLNGPQGVLEARLQIPEAAADYIAVICHPHPQYGGTMDNKVVQYTARALNEMGVVVLFFNFRGIGESTGNFDDAVGEIDDCLAAVDWLRERYPSHRLVLAGFSFGAYIAMQAATRREPVALITIAPAVNLYDFSAGESVGCPWLLIQGDADEVVPPEKVKSWIARSHNKPEVVWLSEASHFFHGRLIELSQHIQHWLRCIL